jgi:hypothetical protein
MNSIASIYVPRMSASWTEDEVKFIMTSYKLGIVTYVDFVPVNKKPGFVENIDKNIKSAFIHFSDPVLTNCGAYYISGELPPRIKMDMPTMTFWSKIGLGESYKLYVSKDEYWICLKNKNPIQRTLMNIHQVVENGRHLESLVTAQDAEIKNLKDTITELTKKLDGVNLAIYQLLGGLYCQRTQPYTLNEQLNIIGFGNDYTLIPIDDTHPSGIWPTTRQGDENSTKIEELEKRLQFLEKEL